MVPKTRLLAVIILTLFIGSLLLATGAQRSEAGTPTEIVFWHAMSRRRGEILNDLVAKFNSKNPDVIVKAEFVGAANPKLGNDYNALYSRILEHLAKGNPPVVSQVYENWTTQLIDIGALVPVQKFFKDPRNGMNAQSLSDIVPVFRDANTFSSPEGTMTYTLPFNKSIYVLYYNKTIFNELGLQAPKTWQDLRKAAKTVTAKRNIPGLAFLPSVDLFGHYLYAHGGQFVSKDNKVNFGGNTGVDDLRFWVDMVHKDHSAVPTFDAYDAFKNGKAAMYIETTSKIGGLERTEGLDCGVVPIPKGTTSSYQFAGTNLAIFSKATEAQQKAAWKFIRFMSSPEITTEWAIATGYLPVRVSAINSPQYQEYIAIHPEYAVGIESLKHATVQPRVPAWESIRGILDDAMFKALGQKYTPEQAIQEAVESSTQLLSSIAGA